jgi:nicotinic acid mononucleotide adenylyltransferase
MTITIKKGIFWGSFDPPTLAHQAIIYRMGELFTDNFIIVKNDAEKKYFVPIEHRLEMLYNILPPNTNKYQVLVQNLQNNYDYFDIHESGNDNLYIVVGMDALFTWLQQHQVDELIKYDGVYVVPRNTSSSIDITRLTKIKIMEINGKYNDVSSTAVRNALKLKEYKSIALDRKVLTYINNNKLYSF